MNTWNKNTRISNMNFTWKFLIEKYHDKISLDDYKSTNYALSLSNLIIDQQISFKAAITIKKRFAVLIKNLSHREILDLDNDKIQSIGISFRKVEYIKNVFSFNLLSKFKIECENIAFFREIPIGV